MKYIYKLKNLDCAACADKIERGIKKINGINDTVVDFMTQKILIDADSSKIDEINVKISAVIKNIDPDCLLVI